MSEQKRKPGRPPKATSCFHYMPEIKDLRKRIDNLEKQDKLTAGYLNHVSEELKGTPSFGTVFDLILSIGALFGFIQLAATLVNAWMTYFYGYNGF